MAKIDSVEQQIAAAYRKDGYRTFWITSFKESPEEALPQLRVLQKHGKLIGWMAVSTLSGRDVWRGREAEYIKARVRTHNFEHYTTAQDPLVEPVLSFILSPSWELELQP